MIQSGWWCSEVQHDEAELAPFGSLLGVWRSKHAGKGLPRWQDFEISDFKGWLGFLLLVKLNREPVCVLFGTKLRLYFGGDFTLRRPSAIFGPRARTIGIGFELHLADVASRGQIGLCGFDLSAADARGPVAAISLPLADNGVLTAFRGPLPITFHFDPYGL